MSEAKFVNTLRSNAESLGDFGPNGIRNSMEFAADEIERLTTALASANEMLGRVAPMLDRLAFYEGNVNQPAKALADEIRALLQSIPNKGDGSNG